MANREQYQLPNGASLSYATYGDPAAHPVLIMHGLVGSIVSEDLEQSLAAYPFRFIAVARPGYGTSDLFAMHRVLDWAEQLGPFLDDVVGGDFDVVAFSAGAPYAYSLAVAYPDRVRHVAINGGLPALYRLDVLPLYGDSAVPFYDFVNAADDATVAAALDQLFFQPLSDVDLASVDVSDARANGCLGMIREARLQAVDWGFTLADVSTPVTIVHVATDAQVPWPAVERTAAHLPLVEIVLLPSGDHCDDASSAVTLEGILERHRAAGGNPST